MLILSLLSSSISSKTQPLYRIKFRWIKQSIRSIESCFRYTFSGYGARVYSQNCCYYFIWLVMVTCCCSCYKKFVTKFWNNLSHQVRRFKRGIWNRFKKQGEIFSCVFNRSTMYIERQDFFPYRLIGISWKKQCYVTSNMKL